ncbi:MAG TPA: HAMP domain-containing sensor histidine kinase [Acidimicrobiia bacterium]|nr:HAMP domain-containing sensor histidine kinase [Acidimicrobiia bacterium]
MSRRSRLLAFVSATVAVAVMALAVAEATMDMSPADRRLLYLMFAAMVVVTVGLGAASLRWAPRLSSLVTSLRLVAVAAVVVAAGVVAAAALTMFIEPHDLTLVLVALLLGVGLGSVLALAVAGSLTSDLARLAATARAVGEGGLSRAVGEGGPGRAVGEAGLGIETGIDRRDELGEAAAAFDGMIRRLAEAEARQQAAEEERRSVIAGIGHDLRTPLASLQASLEAVTDGVAPDPERYLRGMATDVDLLRRLVDDLFLLARLEAGSHPIRPEVVDVGELVDESVEAMLPLGARRGVALSVTGPGRPVPVMADAVVVGRILRNLVDNALRHAPSGTEVGVGTEVGDGWVRVVVSDAGPGFPPGADSTVFERSRPADSGPAQAGGGTGLGLPIARELARLGGGEVEILGGAGGRVSLRLPRR